MGWVWQWGGGRLAPYLTTLVTHSTGHTHSSTWGGGSNRILTHRKCLHTHTPHACTRHMHTDTLFPTLTIALKCCHSIFDWTKWAVINTWINTNKQTHNTHKLHHQATERTEQQLEAHRAVQNEEEATEEREAAIWWRSQWIRDWTREQGVHSVLTKTSYLLLCFGLSSC